MKNIGEKGDDHDHVLGRVHFESYGLAFVKVQPRKVAPACIPEHANHTQLNFMLMETSITF